MKIRTLYRRLISAGIVPAVLLCAGVATAAPGLGDKTVSSSKQFVVYGTDPQWRGAIASVADETKQWLLGKLRMPDRWRTPVVIQVQPASTAHPRQEPARLMLFTTEAGAKIQLDLIAGKTDRPVSVSEEVLRAVLLEMALRDSPQILAGAPYGQPPAWLVTGLATLYDLEQGREKSDVFESLLRAGSMPPLAAFLETPAWFLEGMSHRIRCAYAAALVRALLDLPGGQSGIPRYVTARLDPATQDLPALETAFPSSGGPDGIEKWWSLALAKLASADVGGMLSIDRTRKALEELLMLRIPQADGGTREMELAGLPGQTKSAGRAEALEGVASGFARLGLNANPIYRPVTDAYMDAVRQLAAGKDRPAVKKMREAEQLRKQIDGLSEHIVDHMNWVEATQVGVRSGAFDTYMQTARKADARRAAPRNDPISQYLDTLEAELE